MIDFHFRVRFYGDIIVSYIDFSEMADFPLGLARGMSISEIINLLGIDGEAIGILRCSSFEEAESYCRDNRISASVRISSDTNLLTVPFGNGSVRFEQYRLNDIYKSISINDSKYTFSISFYDDLSNSFSVSVRDE